MLRTEGHAIVRPRSEDPGFQRLPKVWSRYSSGSAPHDGSTLNRIRTFERDRRGRNFAANMDRVAPEGRKNSGNLRASNLINQSTL